MTEHVPAEVAEKKADAAGGAEGQPADDGTENAQSAMQDAAAAGAMGGQTIVTLHAADSMGRLLFSR